MFKTTIFFLFIFVGILPVIAQDRYAQTVTKLAGNNSKQWIFVKIDPYLGGEKKCTRGEKWIFSKTGKVIITRCINQQIQSEERSWTIEIKSPLDIMMRVGNENYVLLFPPKQKNSNQDKMILRIKAQRRSEKTKDLIFYYEVD